jgi:enoyl-CoA hydratase/carnithine racemase
MGHSNISQSTMLSILEFFETRVDGQVNYSNFVEYIREYLENKYGEKVVREDGLKVITIDRKEKSNAISRSLLSELHEEILGSMSKIRCLMITGAGEKVFCAGADLEERKDMSKTEIITFLDKFRSTLASLESISVPTIASLNGSAFGGGLELALACDIRLAQDESLLGLTETKLGIIPGAGGTQRLSRLIGLSKAKDLIFRGAKITSSEALELGVVNKVFKKESYLDDVKKYTDQILTSAPLSVQFSKRALINGYLVDFEDGLDIERLEYLKTLDTKDRLEALQAFREKRSPIFRGE